MKSILQNSATNFNADDLEILAYLTVEDLQTDIRKLKDQIEIAKDELADLEEGHKERPYLPEFMTKMRRSYRDWLCELRDQIAKTHTLLHAKEAMQN